MNNGMILLLVGGCVLTAGDIIMKKWVLTNSPMLYFYGMLVYTFALNFVALSFKYKNISVATIIFILVNVISFVLINWFYFGEKLNTMQMIGIGLGLASVIVLEAA
jgi:multidrug transporter EmrE-like cation transporter